MKWRVTKCRDCSEAPWQIFYGSRLVVRTISGEVALGLVRIFILGLEGAHRRDAQGRVWDPMFKVAGQS